MASEPDLDEWFPFVWLTPNSFDAHEDLDWPVKNADLRVHWGVGEWMVGYVRVDAARAWQAFRDWCGSDAIRALEAKVRELELDKQAFWNSAQQSYTQALKNGASANEFRADRDRLAGEVERLELRVAHWQQLHEHAINATAALSADAISLTDDNARLTAELAAARENEARMAHLVSEDCHGGSCRVYLASDELPIRDMTDEDIIRIIDEDAARRAGGEG